MEELVKVVEAIETVLKFLTGLRGTTLDKIKAGTDAAKASGGDTSQLESFLNSRVRRSA